MGRGETTDAVWAGIEPLLPQRDGAGRPWRDHRQVVNGVLWRLRTGAPWRDLPERYGPWQTVYRRFARWEKDGTWAALLREVQVRSDVVGAMEWTVSIESTAARAHWHAAGAPQKGDRPEDESDDPAAVACREALGRSRGGLTTKIHLGVDGRGLPLSIVLSTGNTADCTMLAAVLDAIRVPRVGAGRPRTGPERVVADKAYSSRKIRRLLRRRRIKATTPERRDRIAGRAHRASRGGRPPAFDKTAYQGRNIVERCFAKLKQFRAVATRFDKLANHYRTGVVLASLILWLRAEEH
ncbi:IS5 family transposase [Kitasatospora sp. NPDC057198]|uniref:IS5 family transposase n=1 Tax=Kitasatospora sp. NPDC057198 TaxID=3346046 RepID=UPI003642A77C